MKRRQLKQVLLSALFAAIIPIAGATLINTSGARYFASESSDGTPNSFTFTDQSGVSLSSTITSAAVTISGIDISITCTATGGTIDKNGDNNFQSSQSISNSNTIRARHTSSASNSTATNTAVTCGGVSDTFSSTTLSAGGGDEVVTLTLTSPSTGTLPYTFGQVFEPGDVPSDMFITTSSSSSQADIRNRWDDGSVKYAVISGIDSFTADTPKAIDIETTPTPPSCSDVAEPTTLDVEIVLTTTAAGTYTLQSALGVDRSTWSKAGAGRVRSIPGCVMSEFHYYKPTSDAHLAIWWYVRAYSNGAIEVETVLENGWLNQSSPTEKDYGVSLDINGSSVYSGTLDHYAHTRWSRVDWASGGAHIVPQHDASYLRATRLVPNYRYNDPESDALDDLSTDTINPAPFTLGDYSSDPATGGNQDPIGILGMFDAYYTQSADARAYRAVVGNARNTGRHQTWFRDETTGKPPLLASYSTLKLFNSDSGGRGETAPPTMTGGQPGGGNVSTGWDTPHHPSIGFLAYVVEGRWTQLETLQLTGSYLLLDTRRPDRNLGDGHVLPALGAPLTTRGAAWTWRTIGQAAAISPEELDGNALSASDQAVRDQYVTAYQNTMKWLRQRYIEGSIDSGAHKNTVGWLGMTDGGNTSTGWDAGPSGEFWDRGFMWYFQAQALNYVADLGIQDLDTPHDPLVVANFISQGILQLFGTEETFNFRRAAQYNMPFLKNYTDNEEFSTPEFMTFAERYTALKSYNSLSSISANSGDTLKKGGTDGAIDMGDDTNSDVNGYWAQLKMVVDQAMDHGVDDAYRVKVLVEAASNYSPENRGPGQAQQPQFSHDARGPPDWYTALTPNIWNALPNVGPYNDSDIIWTTRVADGLGTSNPVYPWSSGVHNKLGLIADHKYIQGHWLAIWGGGHNNTADNSVIAVGPFGHPTLAPTWRRISNPSVPTVIDECRTPDGGPPSAHTYDSLYFDPVRNKLFSAVKPHIWFDGDTCFDSDYFSFGVDALDSFAWEQLDAFMTTNNLPREGLIGYVRERDTFFYIATASETNFETPLYGEYNPKTDTWTDYGNLAPGDDFQSYPDSAYDEVTRLALFRGSGTIIKMMDLTSTSNDMYTPNLTGASLPQTPNPAIVWDPDEQAFFIKPTNNTRTLYKIARPATNFREGGSAWTVTVETPSSGGTPNQPSEGRAPHGKFMDLPWPTPGLLLITDEDQEAWFMPRTLN
jgi:hypothetical protein